MRLGSVVDGNHQFHNAVAARIARRKAILDLIADRRRREGDPEIGAAIERHILDDELSRIEAECVVGS